MSYTMNTENERQTKETKDISSGGNTLQAALPEENVVAPLAGAMPDSVSSHTKLSTLSRQRASTADLIKAHVALMEKEVILPKHGDLFRLVQHHYYRLQTWHDQ